MAAGYKDWAAGNVLTAADLEDYTVLQSVMRFASASARDTALASVLTEGLVAYLIDTNTLTIYTGSAWSTVGPVHGALTSWTPAVVQSGSVTATVTYAKYKRQGRAIQFWADLAITGSGTGSNVITVSLPVTASTSGHYIGDAEVTDASASSNYTAIVRLLSTTTVDFHHAASTASDKRLGAAIFTAGLASGDFIRLYGSYEASADA